MRVNPKPLPPTLPTEHGLRLYLPFSFSQGTTARDMSGRGKHGTIYGKPAYHGGQIGTCLFFDGINDWVDTVDDTSFLASKGSWSLWIRPYKLATSGLIDKMDAGFTAGIIFILGGTDGTVQVYINGGAPNISLILLTLMNWQHLVLTWNGTTYSLYKNGILRSTATRVSPTASGTTLQIGRYGGGNYFKGDIDEVKVYNRCLSNAEVKKLYVSGKLYIRH